MPPEAPRRAWPVIVAALIVAAPLCAVAVLSYRPATLPAAAGSWQSVTLVNGQVYYGRLAEAAPQWVRLTDVYYVVSNGQGNRLVNRQRNDWHGPASQTIPVEKIIMMEAVGPDSQLAKLIAADAAPQR